MMKGLGQGVREFKKGIKEIDEDVNRPNKSHHIDDKMTEEDAKGERG